MKAIHLFGIFTASICMVSCLSEAGVEVIDNPTDPQTAQEVYNNKFTTTYGKPAANQDWGFATDFASSRTRTSNPNSNQWAESYVLPAAITNDEITTVYNAFKNAKGVVSEEVNWSNFFIQHVYLGTDAEHTYKAENGGDVVAGNQMNHLICGENDHVYNFNVSAGSTMLMEDSSTKSFAYANSSDSGKPYYKYLILNVNGAYYVGFDFEAKGQNPNEKIAGDGVYTDWIVKIGMAQRIEGKRIICEDLGSTGDFDFNDIVVDVCPMESWKNKTVVTLQAAGGRLPATLMLGSKTLGETHQLFGVAEGEMVNTGAGPEKPAVQMVVEGKYEAKDFKIVVLGDDKKERIINKPGAGEVPAMICVPLTYQWAAERQDVSNKYPKFKQFVTDRTIAWWN